MEINPIKEMGETIKEQSSTETKAFYLVIGWKKMAEIFFICVLYPETIHVLNIPGCFVKQFTYFFSPSCREFHL